MHEMLTKYEKFIILKMRDEGRPVASIALKLNRPKAVISDYLINKDVENKDIIKELKSCKNKISDEDIARGFNNSINHSAKDNNEYDPRYLKQNVEIGHRRVVQYVHDITSISMGDPVSGRSALDKKQNAAWYS